MARTRTRHATLALDAAASGRAVPAMELWHEALDGLAGGLADVQASLIATDSSPAVDLPHIAARDTSELVGDGSSVRLPRQGAVVRFRDPRLHGVLLLQPRSRLHDLQVDRRLVFALRDHIEALLLAHPRA